ncbi:hypothetical protein RLV_1817 (plasmid) [Rhizobium leguminosarum bv. viciae]|nr:hypothetical protein RLV_1817 [Rhizobium leguminosarum bv. viciae]
MRINGPLERHIVWKTFVNQFTTLEHAAGGTSQTKDKLELRWSQLQVFSSGRLIYPCGACGMVDGQFSKADWQIGDATTGPP